MNNNIRIIKLTLSASSVKMGGELGAMLGQYNLNIIKFCNEFNESSKIFEKNLPIKVNLLVLEGNTFKIEFKGPSSTFLLKSFIKKNKIKLMDIYKIALIKKANGDIAPIKSICKNILSIVKVKNYEINYE